MVISPINGGHPSRGLTVDGRNPGVQAEASGPVLFCDHRQRDIYSLLSVFPSGLEEIQNPTATKRKKDSKSSGKKGRPAKA